MVYRTSLTGPVFGLRREIDRLFEDTFGRDAGRSGGWSPAVDIREDATEIALEVELPGIKPSDVEVTAENGVLTIRGEKQSTSTEGSEGRYHMVERTYGTFLRSFQLPPGVDENRIEAEFVDGLLTVHVPKAALPQPRRIEIRNSGSQPVVQGTGSRSSVKSGSAEGAGTATAESLGAGRPGRPEGRGGDHAESSGPHRETAGEGSPSRTHSRTSR
ncbi:MAG TPA: Hsp20/alpha crystallin family protein [Gemmatimonadaceae bacterium]|jgi:HSP20 family protein|nr:Hsp20/alpha crystallin family protein [Gemmatimonadaceae bacterium]